MAPPSKSGGVTREGAAGDREVAVAVDAAAVAVAELPVMSVSWSTSVPVIAIPPPLVAELPLTVLESSVSAPLTSMPPPESAVLLVIDGARQASVRPRRRRYRRRRLSRWGHSSRACSPGSADADRAAGATRGLRRTRSW